MRWSQYTSCREPADGSEVDPVADRALSQPPSNPDEGTRAFTSRSWVPAGRGASIAMLSKARSMLASNEVMKAHEVFDQVRSPPSRPSPSRCPSSPLPRRMHHAIPFAHGCPGHPGWLCGAGAAVEGLRRQESGAGDQGERVAHREEGAGRGQGEGPLPACCQFLPSPSSAADAPLPPHPLPGAHRRT